MKETGAACLQTASRQLGLLTRGQALDLGLSEDAILRRLGSGKWRSLFPGVYAIAGSPGSWRQRLLGACFWTEGVASHRAAAALLGLDGFSGPLLEITTVGGFRSSGAGLLIHRRTLDRRDRTVFSGIPVTTPSRTLLDLGSVADFEVVEIALQDAMRKGLTSMFRLHSLLERSGGKGRSGVAVLRRLIGDVSPPIRITESRLESRLFRLISDSGLPLPLRQYEVWDGKVQLARLDFAYPSEMLGIEGDSFSFHSAPVEFQRDREKSNLLTLRGWRILRVTWDDLVNRPGKVIRDIRASLDLTPRNAQAQAQRM